MDTLIDFGLLRGLITVVVFAAFVGVVVWAYSSRRATEFEAASRLPLDEEDAPPAIAVGEGALSTPAVES